MKHTAILLMLLLFILSSCNYAGRETLTPEQQAEQLKRMNDSLIVELDSVMAVNIPIPQLLDSNMFSGEQLTQFNELAQNTGGEIKVLANSRFVSMAINEILKNNAEDGLDLMIIVDKTSSMLDDIQNIKAGLRQIITGLKQYDNVRLAVATYGDRWADGSEWFSYRDFGQDLEQCQVFIDDIHVTSGGDYPESVYDGVYNAFKKGFWKSSSKRIVLLLGDAPSLTGRQSNHTAEEIVALAKADDINMNFYPIVLSPQQTGYYMPESMQNLSFIESVYPNPTAGAVNVQFNQINDLTLEVFNSTGTKVLTESIAETNIRLDLYDQPTGVYVIRVSDKQKNYDAKKIVIRR